MRVLVAGGGTGGHFYPALTIIEGIRRRHPDASIGYVGTSSGIEARVLPEKPWVRFFPIRIRGMHPRGGWRNGLVILQLLIAFVQTLAVFARFRPNVVIGVGGHSSFPPVLLAAILGKVLPIRTMIHEQNVIGGLANRWLSRFVDLVLISFEESKRSFPRAKRMVVSGNPIREEFLHVRRSDDMYDRFGLDPNRRTILIFGGSRGAEDITEQILFGRGAIAQIDGLQILLATGDQETADRIRREMREAHVTNVVVTPYIEEMAEAFAIADLVVCRSGATSLAEITGCGKPSLLIPWRGAADDHQWKNARLLEAENACAVAEEGVIVRHKLVDRILDLIHDEWTLTRLATNAARLGNRKAGSRIQGEIRTLMGEAGT